MEGPSFFFDVVLRTLVGDGSVVGSISEIANIFIQILVEGLSDDDAAFLIHPCSHEHAIATMMTNLRPVRAVS